MNFKSNDWKIKSRGICASMRPLQNRSAGLRRGAKRLPLRTCRAGGRRSIPLLAGFCRGLSIYASQPAKLQPVPDQWISAVSWNITDRQLAGHFEQTGDGMIQAAAARTAILFDFTGEFGRWMVDQLAF